MTSDTIGGSYGTLGRFCLSKLAMPRSPNLQAPAEPLHVCGRASLTPLLLGRAELRGRKSGVSGNWSGAGSGSYWRRNRWRPIRHRKPHRPHQRDQRCDQPAANQRPQYLVERCAERVDCRVLPCRIPQSGLTATERWERVRQFVSVLEQQIAANRLAPGTLLIANVPLPPNVFRELRSQAAASGQTTTQLMAAILTRAAGK